MILLVRLYMFTYVLLFNRMALYFMIDNTCVHHFISFLLLSSASSIFLIHFFCISLVFLALSCHICVTRFICSVLIVLLKLLLSCYQICPFPLAPGIPFCIINTTRFFIQNSIAISLLCFFVFFFQFLTIVICISRSFLHNVMVYFLREIDCSVTLT